MSCMLNVMKEGRYGPRWLSQLYCELNLRASKIRWRMPYIDEHAEENDPTRMDIYPTFAEVAIEGLPEISKWSYGQSVKG